MESKKQETVKEIIVSIGYELSITTDIFKVMIKKNEENVCSIKCGFEDSGTDDDIDSSFTADYDEENAKLNVEAKTSYKNNFRNPYLIIITPNPEKLFINSENGMIKIKNMESNFEIYNENSSTKIMSCSGKFIIKSDNGSIKVLDVKGDLDIKCENGSCKIEEISGSLIINEENGQVRVMKSSCNNADITSENGSIYYEFLPIDEGRFNFKNENGKIQLIVPESIEYSIEASNENGGFHIGIDGDYSTKREEECKVLHMIKGSGKVKVVAKNENGSFAILSEPSVKTHRINSFWNEDRKVKLESTVKAALKAIEKVTEKFSEKIEENVTKENLDKLKMKVKKLNESDFSKKISDDINDLATDIGKTFGSIGKEIGDIFKSFDSKSSKNEEKRKAEKFTDVEDGDFEFASPSENASGETLNKEENNNDKESNLKAKLRILKMVEEKKVTIEEAEKLLRAIES